MARTCLEDAIGEHVEDLLQRAINLCSTIYNINSHFSIVQLVKSNYIKSKYYMQSDTGELVFLIHISLTMPNDATKLLECHVHGQTS